MPFSYLAHLECPKCGETYDAAEVQQLCSCGAPLLARYALTSLKAAMQPSMLVGREPTLWRYHEFLPVTNEAHVVSLGEGMTPILALPRYGKAHGLSHLSVKDEGLLPTGSFKARGAAVGVSKAKELGVKTLAMPTNGNAGAAWAAYAARAGMECTIVIPASAPRLPRVECSVVGAHTYLVDGLISDAGSILAAEIKERGWFDAATLKEPYRIEGKKTMGLEIAEQFAFDPPDVILYPTGGGVGLIGIHKAMQELMEIGWIKRLPRLVAVQAEGCAPIVKAFKEGASESQFWPDAHTIAFGITVPKALGDFLVLSALRETGGTAIAVSDEAIMEAQGEAAASDGLYLCPEGAATLVAAAQLRAQGLIGADERVVALNTGTALKYTEQRPATLPQLAKGARLPIA